MAHYGFFTPILPGKLAKWKECAAEMKGARKDDLAASRRRAGFRHEHVWLQHTPQGDFAVVHWEVDDVGKAFHHLLSSTDPFDKWFRDKILVEVHGMDPNAPPPPLNETILG